MVSRRGEGILGGCRVYCGGDGLVVVWLVLSRPFFPGSPSS